MLYTKACPRCTGDVKLDRDNYGVYAKCLQCGFNRDFATRRDLPSQADGLGSIFGSSYGSQAEPVEMPLETEEWEAA